MEQWRWMPEDLGKLYVTVNIPEYTLRVIKNGQVIHTERVITGEISKQTPIFSQDMQSAVFHPGWGVPNSIKVIEVDAHPDVARDDRGGRRRVEDLIGELVAGRAPYGADLD